MNVPKITTHQIVNQPGNVLGTSSTGLGWRLLAASAQREMPYNGSFPAVEDHLLVFNLDQPARVACLVSGRHTERLVPAGGFFLWPGREQLSIGIREPVDTLHLYVQRNLVEEVAMELDLAPTCGIELIRRNGQNDLFLENLVREVRHCLAPGEGKSAVYSDYLARLIAARLVRSHSNRASGSRASTLGVLSQAQVERVRNYIDANLAESIELCHLAAAGGLSPTWFARRFRATTGMPPHQYVLRCRIDQAKRLLARKDMPIAEIALDCGFSHQEHLNRAFRRFTGTTPGAFRKQTFF